MFTMTIGLVIMVAATIIFFIESSLPLAPKIFIAVAELFLLVLLFRPDSVRRKEMDEHMNAMLKFNDEQKIVEKCKGCIHVREPYGKCSVYLYPWEAWVHGYNRVCEHYQPAEQIRREGDLSG